MWLTQEMFIWWENNTQGISNSEDFHLSALEARTDFNQGHVTTYFRTRCQRSVSSPKDLNFDILHSMKIKYWYTKPQSPIPFQSNSLATFVQNCGAKPFPQNLGFGWYFTSDMKFAFLRFYFVLSELVLQDYCTLLKIIMPAHSVKLSNQDEVSCIRTHTTAQAWTLDSVYITRWVL